MVEYLGYFIIFLLLLLFSLFLKVSIEIEKREVERYFEKEKEKVRITKILLKKEKNYRARMMSEKIKKHPQIKTYLGQVSIILEKGAYDFSQVEITTMKDRQVDKEYFDKEKFFEEIQTAPNVVKEEVIALSNILGSILELKHPTRYKYIEFKKNNVLRILSLVVKILEVLPKLNKFEKTENKRGSFSEDKNMYASGVSFIGSHA